MVLFLCPIIKATLHGAAFFYALVAQQAEQRICNPQVVGSSPTDGSTAGVAAPRWLFIGPPFYEKPQPVKAALLLITSDKLIEGAPVGFRLGLNFRRGQHASNSICGAEMLNSNINVGLQCAGTQKGL